MSRRLGHTGHRYVTTVSAPYPGYRVNIPRQDRPRAVLSKAFCGHAKPLDDYLIAALAWRDATCRSLHGMPVPVRGFAGVASDIANATGIRRVVKKVTRRLACGNVRIYEVPCIVAEVHRRGEYPPYLHAE